MTRGHRYRCNDCVHCSHSCTAIGFCCRIQTAKNCNKTPSTGEDTTDMMAGKIFINSVVLTNAGADLYITFELAPGSDPIDPNAVEYNLICLETGARTGAPQSGNFGTVAGITATAASALGTAGAADPLNPATTYTVTLTPTGNCAPQINTTTPLWSIGGATDSRRGLQVRR